MLFGKPAAVSAELRRERDGQAVNDAFTLRLRYPGLTVVPRRNLPLRARASPLPPARRQGQLLEVRRRPAGSRAHQDHAHHRPPWGQETSSHWGTLAVDVDGGMVTRPVQPIPGDYRHYYAGIRDALLGKAPAPTSPIDSWRVARIMEWAN